MKFENDFSIAYFKERKPIWGLLESCGITVFWLCLTYIIRPEDPLFLKGPIPWLVLAPVFSSLLYGYVNGLLSLFILGIYIVYQQQTHTLDGFVLREYTLGLICLTLLSGIFSSYWLARIRHVEYLNRYVREHLDSLSNDYYLLQISHERIEHAYISKPFSFREAYAQLKQEIINNDFAINNYIATYLLNICAQYCTLNRAIFCFFDPKDNVVRTIAALGEVFPVNLQDPLIRNALEQNITSYYAVNTLESDEASEYLVMLPFLNTERQMIGFVLVKDMPFWALTLDNLEGLTVLVSAFALKYSTLKEVEELLGLFPNCEPEFLREFQTLVYLKKYHKVESFLTAIMIPDCAAQEKIIYSLEQIKRSMDYTWIVSVNRAKLFITLMPLTTLSGVQGYRKRIADWLKSNFGEVLSQKGFIFRSQPVNVEAISVQLENYLNEFTHASD